VEVEFRLMQGHAMTETCFLSAVLDEQLEIVFSFASNDFLLVWTMSALFRFGVATWLFASVLSQNTPRSFKKLSGSDLLTVATLKDVTYNVDHTNPKSHLAHILIPRPRTS
jgi:hypothetical protein